MKKQELKWGYIYNNYLCNIESLFSKINIASDYIVNIISDYYLLCREHRSDPVDRLKEHLMLPSRMVTQRLESGGTAREYLMGCMIIFLLRSVSSMI